MANERETLSSPKGGAFSITPHDTNDLSIAATAIWCGGAGTIKVDTTYGQTVSFVGVVAGIVLPVRVTRVYSTGTTATDLVGLY